MQSAPPIGISTPLEQLHQRIDAHFRQLAEERQELGAGIPVFALEHGLDDGDLAELRDVVRVAVAQGLGLRYRKWWLPFVVYAAELGYRYVGGEYWHTFEVETPRWDEINDRDWVRSQFRKFADQYCGVRPKGAFAKNFPIIAWPITHAVLPIYLQRHLAHLLYGFRTGLTSDLLNDPEALGARLAARAGGYTERFRIFCENTSLLGSVAIALLGDGSQAPYLLASTQQRLVEDLSTEQESRQWLTSAQRTASRVRAKGFAARAGEPATPRALNAGRVVSPRVDPRLRLRRRDDKWQVWAHLPDLTSLSLILGEGADELRGRNAVVQGVDGMLPTDMHLRSGQMKRLNQWPSAGRPFMQLKGASAETNAVIAAQCAMGGGPAWLFRLQQPTELAEQIKSCVIRPGRKYIVVQREGSTPLQLPWSSEVPLEVTGVCATALDVPLLLDESARSALVAAGLTVITDFTVQPIGLVASAWDGEGEMEWLADGAAAIAITSEIAPLHCVVRLDGTTYRIPWPTAQRELLLQLGDLEVGRHELVVQLVSGDHSMTKPESLFVTIRDPQIRPDSATAAEGIRMFVSPSRPTLADLWDGHASLSIEGPPNSTANLQVLLKSDTGSELAQIELSESLPVTESQWTAIAARIREEPKFADGYDDAESVKITVSRAGVGFATLTCDRGFQPLRWKIKRLHHGEGFTACLADRTDGSNTQAELFSVRDPLTPAAVASGAVIPVPALGGLLRATSGDLQQAIVLPTQPTEVLQAGQLRPHVDAGGGSSQAIILRLAQAYRMWAEAERPGDPFGQYVQRCVLEALTREAVSSVTGTFWASVERRFPDTEQAIDFLNQLRDAVGISQPQKALAEDISRALWEWSTPDKLLIGFEGLIGPTLRQRGLGEVPSASRFLLRLAGRLDGILEWDESERDKILEAVVMSPVLLRAARFAVLGSRAFIEAEEAARGF
ncbi:hypothetical protein P3F83_18565 [Mycobacteroides immunogenum]|uniref:hypothetical protein n=1 Tax=Mycobacteroides immunogenum TaxID=83262 RepID=UPI0025B7807E|nr:hypothetical protein [Mycobacteroides immunogenum]WJR32511.1 hypothetical protein P3F83_18565 [Mycobacteroides immunogenum]